MTSAGGRTRDRRQIVGRWTRGEQA